MIVEAARHAPSSANAQPWHYIVVRDAAVKKQRADYFVQEQQRRAAAEPSLAVSSVPVLLLQGTADQGIFPSDTESLFAASGTDDRELQWIPGGTHYFANQPSHQADVYDRITQWLARRGMAP
ncbi:MAG: nitroreductase family protein [Candidatus Dormibacteraeota bacterium]|nr:nitroreductase family protein [Candidatus Dormibacteraeota bacterium]